MTSDLGRVTTTMKFSKYYNNADCGDVRSRTSYNKDSEHTLQRVGIAVTSDLGRVTTARPYPARKLMCIAVTSDLGRVTTNHKLDSEPAFKLR